jgi:hypothetical protein
MGELVTATVDKQKPRQGGQGGVLASVGTDRVCVSAACRADDVEPW